MNVYELSQKFVKFQELLVHILKIISVGQSQLKLELEIVSVSEKAVIH